MSDFRLLGKVPIGVLRVADRIPLKYMVTEAFHVYPIRSLYPVFRMQPTASFSLRIQ